MTIEFKAWPKTTRLFRPVIVTEKIDGTNACVIFEKPYGYDTDSEYVFAAQSRNRLITPDSDNAGFAAWVYENHGKLFELLGYGRHYGEWWGRKVGRKYDMDHKVFSIFNGDHWHKMNGDEKSIAVGDAFVSRVPVLGRFDMNTNDINSVAAELLLYGSIAAAEFGKEFMNPEGICVFDPLTGIVKKFTFDNNDKGKWEGLK